jgi:predicted PurR-regulated permease PerM
MVVLMLPAIGVWITWAPATLSLFLTDGLLSAAVLLVYGLTVLTLIDDVPRAYLVN